MKFYCDHKRHLVCVPYSVENLHRMATELNINRCWFHAGNRPHYDIPKTRITEIQAKCEIVSPKRILLIISNSMKSNTMPETSEQYPSRYDLIPGTAQRVMDQARWFVLRYKPHCEVFAALSERPSIGVWDGYTLELEEDGTYDVSETSLGTTLLNSLIESRQWDITSDRETVAAFFNDLRIKRAN